MFKPVRLIRILVTGTPFNQSIGECVMMQMLSSVSNMGNMSSFLASWWQFEEGHLVSDSSLLSY